MTQKRDWKSIGYSAAIGVCTHSMASFPYPTQDVHTREDERLYSEGFSEGISDFKNRGVQTLVSYADEKNL